MNLRIPLVAAGIATALLLSACNSSTPPEKPAVVAPVPVAEPAPAATPTPAKPAADAPKPETPGLAIATFGGGKFTLAEHRGKWVVVNFWATWCTPCLKEIPDLNAFDKERDDVDVIGLAYEEIERVDMEAFLKEHPISYPIAVLDVYNPPADFDTPRGLPMTYLIAPDGKVAKKFLGPITSGELEKAMAAYTQAAPRES